MAENPIRKEDIIDSESIIAEIKELIGLLKTDLVGALEAVKKSAKETGESLKTANPATDEGRQKIKNLAVEIEVLTGETNQLTDSQKKLIEIENKLQSTYDDVYKDEVRLKNALRDRNKEVADQVRMDNLADGSLAKLRLQLAALKKAYTEASPAARGSILEGLQKADKEVKKLEASMGVHSRKVGDYGLALKGVGIKILELTGITAGFAGALKLGKEIIESTDTLSDKFKVTLSGWTGGFMAIKRAIANDDFKNFFKNIRDAIDEGRRYAMAEEAINDAARAMKIRIGENETAIILLREAQNDATRTESERLEKGKEAEKLIKQNAEDRVALAEMILANDIKNAAFAAKTDEKTVKSYLDQNAGLMAKLELGKKYNELLAKQAGLQAIINVGEGDLTSTLNEKRAVDQLVNSTSAEIKAYGLLATGLGNITDAQKDKITADYEAIEASKQSAINLRVSSKVDSLTAKANKELAGEIDEVTAAMSRKSAESIKYNADNYYQGDTESTKKVDPETKLMQDSLPTYEEVNEQRKQIHNKRVADELEAEKEKEQKVRDIAIESLNAIQSISEGFFQTRLNQLDRERNKELSNKNLTEAQKTAINKKYAREEQEIAKKKIIINTALGVMQVWAGSGPWWLKLIQSVAVLGEGAWAYSQAAQEQFGEGGEVKGKRHSQGGAVIEAEGGEYVIKRSSTAKYHDLIEAINKDNPMAIAEEIRNRHFHTVWGGVSAELSQASRQDPYTQKMYELMKNDVKVYIDSNGDTVINYPDGSKRIIRKYTA